MEFVQVHVRTNLVLSKALEDRLRAAAGASAFYGEIVRDIVFRGTTGGCFEESRKAMPSGKRKGIYVWLWAFFLASPGGNTVSHL